MESASSDPSALYEKHGDLVGSGSFGAVVKVKRKSDGRVGYPKAFITCEIVLLTRSECCEEDNLLPPSNEFESGRRAA